MSEAHEIIGALLGRIQKNHDPLDEQAVSEIAKLRARIINLERDVKRLTQQRDKLIETIERSRDAQDK